MHYTCVKDNYVPEINYMFFFLKLDALDAPK